MHVFVILFILSAAMCADVETEVGFYLIARNSPMGRPKSLTLNRDGVISFEDLEKNNNYQLLTSKRSSKGTICLKNSSKTCIDAKELKIDRKKRYPRKLDAIFCPLNYKKSQLVLNVMPYRDNVQIKIKGCHLLCLFSNPKDTKPDAGDFDPHLSHCKLGNINNMFIFVAEDRIDAYLAEQKEDKDDLEAAAEDAADAGDAGDLENPPSPNVSLESLAREGSLLNKIKHKSNLRRYYIGANRPILSPGGGQPFKRVYT